MRDGHLIGVPICELAAKPIGVTPRERR